MSAELVGVVPGVVAASTLAAAVDSAEVIPTLPVVAPLFPRGLRRGHVLSVQGSTSVMWTVIAEATQRGSWAAIVGLPTAGMAAASELQVSLDRLVLIPDPRRRLPDVVAALIDGIDVVVINPVAITSKIARQITDRARNRKAVVIAVGPWDGAHHNVRCRVVSWTGLGDGYGFAQSGVIQARAAGRGAAAREVTADIPIPLPRAGDDRSQATRRFVAAG